MTPRELEIVLHRELADFPGQTAVYVADPRGGAPLFSHQADVVFPSASLIKLTFLLTALDQVKQGKLSLKDEVSVSQSALQPDSIAFEEGETVCPLEELLTWMIITSDNVAANVVLHHVSMDAINDYTHNVLGLKDTVCRRKMLDYDAAREGRENVTTVADQYRVFSLLYNKEILTPELCDLAISILCRQRSHDAMGRYVCSKVPLAHKTGSLDGVAHDCGIFLHPKRPLFVGVCSWDGPSPDGDPVQLRYLGRLARAIYNTYLKDREED